MSGLAGFDFERLNRRFLTDIFKQPVNLAADYGVSVIKAKGSPAWRCIGVYRLAPTENRSRHNVFVDVLDENGLRTRTPVINWTWWIDAPMQTVRLDKPDNEPAADIPIEYQSTITVRVNGDDLPSDSVGNLHTRHNDEAEGNTRGHFSYYVVFQKQSGNIVTPPTPGPTEPSQPALTLEQRVAELERRMDRYEGDGR